MYPIGGLLLDDIEHLTCPECGHYFNPSRPIKKTPFMSTTLGMSVTMISIFVILAGITALALFAWFIYMMAQFT